jgi:membrane protein
MEAAVTLKEFFTLFKEAAAAWQADNAPRLAASLAYYALFSLAPAILVALAVAGLAFGREAAEDRLFFQIAEWVGPESAEIIQTLLASLDRPGSNVLLAAVGLAAVFYGASNLFGQLGDALNTVWNVAPDPEQGTMAFIKNRLSAFAMVLTVGFLLLISLFVSAAITTIDEYFAHLVPEILNWVLILRVADLVLSFLFIAALVAAIYRILPNATIAWRDVWVGAAVTAFFFTLTKFLVGLYLGYSGVASAYGAAGSIILLMLWIYYMAQVFLFGAEFTYVYANSHGSRVRTGRYGIKVQRQFVTVEEKGQARQAEATARAAAKADATARAGAPASAEAPGLAEKTAVVLPPPVSPLTPILLPYVDRLPPVLRDQSLLPVGAGYRVVLEGHLDEIWQRPGWLSPFFRLLARAGLLIAETGRHVPARMTVTAVQDGDGLPCHVWHRTFDFPAPRHLHSRLSYDAELACPVEYFGPGGRLQMVWRLSFQEPLTLAIATEECALLLGPWRVVLPAWSYAAVAFTTRAESAHVPLLRIELRLRHPWLGAVFGYHGRFQQRLEVDAQEDGQV